MNIETARGFACDLSPAEAFEADRGVYIEI